MVEYFSQELVVKLIVDFSNYTKSISNRNLQFVIGMRLTDHLRSTQSDENINRRKDRDVRLTNNLIF